MKKARILAIIAILVMLLATVFFPQFLEITLARDPYLPLGTFVAWFSIISLTSLPWLTTKALREAPNLFFLVLRYVTCLAAGLALLWPFVGRLLAGNWHYNFGYSTSFIGSAEAGYIFWRYTGLIVILPLFVFILILGHYLTRKL